MSEAKAVSYADFVLPPNVVSKLDVAKLVNEAERIDSLLTTQSVRKKTGASTQVTVIYAEQFTAFLEQNKLSFDNGRDRAALIKQLHLLKDNMPVIHMTFAVEADPESLAQLAQWVRTSLHPQAVIAVGLQPGLIAGVYIRTPNHVHDFSMRSLLDGRHDVLVQELETLRHAK